VFAASRLTHRGHDYLYDITWLEINKIWKLLCLLGNTFLDTKIFTFGSRVYWMTSRDLNEYFVLLPSFYMISNTASDSQHLCYLLISASYTSRIISCFHYRYCCHNLPLTYVSKHCSKSDTQSIFDCGVNLSYYYRKGWYIAFIWWPIEWFFLCYIHELLIAAHAENETAASVHCHHSTYHVYENLIGFCLKLCSENSHQPVYVQLWTNEPQIRYRHMRTYITERTRYMIFKSPF
jgi:hypothetical protein